MLGGAPRLAERDKLRVFEHKVRTALGTADLADAPTLGFTFTPLALNIPGASAPNVINTIKQHAKIMSKRSASTPAGIHKLDYGKT